MTVTALRLEAHDSAPVLRQVTLAPPGPGEIAIRIRAAGLNFADLLTIRGQYQEKPALPFTMGLELAGEVSETGPGVREVSPGDRVMVYSGGGALAEAGVFAAARAIPIPEAMPFEDAAAFPIAYGTSHLALSHRARLLPGETLLVLGAAGGVGLTAVEIGKRMGARVIACARGAAKLEAAGAAGADHLIDTDALPRDAGGLTDAVRALGGADVVYDPVGGDLFREAFRATRPDGRILVIGFASGSVPPIPANHLLVKNVTVIGIYWGGYLNFAPDVLTGSLKTLVGWYGEGGLRPHVSHVLPLARVHEGLELLRSRRSTGKVVITP